MAIAPWDWYQYHTVVDAAGDGQWSGLADDDGAPSLLDSRPSVAVSNGRVTLVRRSRKSREYSTASNASFDGGEALAAVLRAGDRLECWRVATGDIGLAVTRAGSLVLGLGALGNAPAPDITTHHDPRIDDVARARDLRYIDGPENRIVWLDPNKPSEFEARLRELDGDIPGVKVLGIVVRTDDAAVSNALLVRTMDRPIARVRTSSFLTASERFSNLEEWLEYSRALPTERPRDVWLGIKIRSRDYQVVEGTSATLDGWLTHVLKVYEPGLPGQFTQLGLVPAATGVTAAMLERSTAAVARGLTIGYGPLATRDQVKASSIRRARRRKAPQA